MKKRELCAILNKMELSDILHESQSKVLSSFQPTSYITYQDLFSNSKEKSKDHFLEES